MNKIENPEIESHMWPTDSWSKYNDNSVLSTNSARTMDIYMQKNPKQNKHTTNLNPYFMLHIKLIQNAQVLHKHKSETCNKKNVEDNKGEIL